MVRPRFSPAPDHRHGPASINPVETCLCAVYELEEQTGRPPRKIDISRYLGITPSSITQRVTQLEEEGLLQQSWERTVQLTGSGQEIATVVIRKQRIVEHLLVALIGLDPESARDEARRWRHVVGDRAERKVFELMHRPTVSPLGDAIPGLEHLRHPVA